MRDILNLQQTGKNKWKATYEGNYGIYTIKITTDNSGKKASNFSCSCPSSYYPCKHISMIEDAIAEQLAFNEKRKKCDSAPQLKDIFKNVPIEKLQEFIITQANYNPELLNAVLLEFVSYTEDTKENKYSKFIRNALESINHDDDYFDSEEDVDIDALDQWLEKAWSCIDTGQYDVSILICKAIIEEYSQWLHNMDEDISPQYNYEYETIPFDIIEKAIEHNDGDKKELFDYCLSEMDKEKYANTSFCHSFHKLLGILAITVDPNAFIALQDRLLDNIENKNSNAAKIILERKIDFYTCLEQEDKAWALIEENIQIESFCVKVVENRIEKEDFEAAKNLISDFFKNQNKTIDRHAHQTWHKLLLDIAQKEKDLPAIRKLAYEYIENGFAEKYYKIYKTAFSTAEWARELENLLLRYNKNHFSSSVANLLAAENDTKRLLEYIEKYLSIEELENYYKFFASDYPEKTIEIFKKVLIRYAEINTGRYHYVRILGLLRKMSHVEGGEKAALELIAKFKVQYKSRRAMTEELNRF
jgi:hypothetical protein